MQKLTNDEIIELLMSLSDRFGSSSVNELITELEVHDEFLN